MKQVFRALLIILLSLSATPSFAMPTTAEKLSCATSHLNMMLESDYKLAPESLDLRRSVNPVNVVYIGTDILSLFAGRGLNGSDVEYVKFKTYKNGQVVFGWMYVLSFVNVKGKAIHDCTVNSFGGLSSISLGKIVLDDEPFELF
jgi:hypothetical protein